MREQNEQGFPRLLVAVGVIAFCVVAWWHVGGEILRFIGPYLQGGHYGP